VQLSTGIIPSKRSDAQSEYASECSTGLSTWTRQQALQNKPLPFNVETAIPTTSFVLADESVSQVVDDSMIGIALGSPGMLASFNQKTVEKLPLQAHETSTRETHTLRRKPTKWKKIGDLFKGKSVPAPAPAPAPAPNPPFYQVQVNGSQLPLSPEFLPEPLAQPQLRHELDQEVKLSNKEERSRGTFTEAWPRLEDTRRPNGKVRHKESRNNLSRGSERQNGVTGSKVSSLPPLLQVDIPDIQMERYSIMFGSVLGKGQSSLLARRSRTLDRLMVPEKESLLTDNPKPQRRATSPAPSKSPSFSLFPATPSEKAFKILGLPSPPQRHCPLLAQSTPAELRQSAAKKDHVILMVQTPGAIQATSQSCLSPTTPFDAKTDDETVRLRMKATKNLEEGTLESGPMSLKENPATRGSDNAPTVQDVVISRKENTYLQATVEKVDDIMGHSSSAANTMVTTVDINTPDPTALDVCAEDLIVDTPNVEVSIARSVSVSRGQKQKLVPLGGRQDRIGSDERLVDKHPLVPMLVDVRRGHHYEKSQNVLIETV
jgi:hypothetical protein